MYTSIIYEQWCLSVYYTVVILSTMALHHVTDCKRILMMIDEDFYCTNKDVCFIPLFFGTKCVFLQCTGVGSGGARGAAAPLNAGRRGLRPPYKLV